MQVKSWSQPNKTKHGKTQHIKIQQLCLNCYQNDPNGDNSKQALILSSVKKMGFYLLVSLHLFRVLQCSFRNSNWDNSNSIQKVNIRPCKTRVLSACDKWHVSSDLQSKHTHRKICLQHFYLCSVTLLCTN